MLLPSRIEAITDAIQAIERTLVVDQAEAATQAGAIIIVLERLGVISFPDTPEDFSVKK